MKNINFLPGQYRQARRQHDSRVSRAWLAIIGLCALGIWFGTGRLQLRQAKARLLHLDNQNKTVQTGLDVIAELNAEQAELLKTHRLAQHLTANLSCVQALAKLAELIPPQVSIVKVSVVGTEGQRSTQGKRNLAKLAKDVSSKTSLEQISQPENTELQLSIVGLAPSEMDVALLVGQLSSCQDFGEVRLEYCRSETVKKHQACIFKVNLLSKAAPLVSALEKDTKP